MTTTLADAYVQIRPDSSKLGPALKEQGEAAGANAGAHTGRTFGSSVVKAIKAAGIGLAIGAAFVGVKVGNYLKDAVADASDLNETVSKSQQIFPKSQAMINAWASTSAHAMGVSRQQALSSAAAFGNFFNQIGIGEAKSAQMSTKILQLASDLGSFNNADPTKVMESFLSATRGEYDSLQAFIPTVNAATIQTEALRLSHKKSAADLTAADKAMALYSISFRDAGKAQGDFARTSEGLANQQRIFKASMTDLRGEIGQALLPTVARLYGRLNSELAPALQQLWAQHGPAVVAMLERFATNVEKIDLGKVVADVKAFFTSASSGKGGTDLGKTFSDLSTSARELAPAVRQFAAEMPSLNDVLKISSTVMKFLADHTDELSKAMPYLVGLVVAYKVAQLAANVAAVVGVPMKVFEVIVNQRLVKSNLALIASRQGLTAATGAGTVATAVNTGAENVGMLTRIRSTASMIAHRVATLAVRGATIAWTAVQWLLNVALTANPIGLIVAAIALLVAGFIYAYRHSDTFRRIVDTTWRTIKHAAEVAIGWLVGTGWPWLQGVINAIVSGVTYMATMWTTRFSQAKAIVTAVLGFIAGFVQDRIAAVRAAAARVAEVATAFKSAFDRANAAVIDRATAIVNFVRGIPGRILSALGNLGSLLVNAGRNLVQGMIDGVSGMVSRLVDSIKNMVDRIPQTVKKLLGIASAAKVMIPLGRNTVEGYLVGVRAMAGDVDDEIGRLLAPAQAPPAATVPQAIAAATAQTGGPGVAAALHDILTALHDILTALQQVAPQVGRELAGAGGNLTQMARAR